MPAMSIAPVGAVRGFSIVETTITMSRVGAWTADLVIAHQDFLTGKVELRIGDSLVLVGSVSRAGIYQGLLHASIVAGANGLRAPVTRKHYTSPTLRKVLGDVLGDVGEALAASSDATVLGTQFEHWTTLVMPAGQAVRCLVERAGADIAWRHLPDGTLWVGRETWPASLVTEFSEAQGANPESDVWNVTLVSPEVLPGTTLGGRRVDQVEYKVNAAGVRTTIYVTP